MQTELPNFSMDISFQTKFVIVFGLCVCPVILFVSMPGLYTHYRKINPSEKLIHLKTAERGIAAAKDLEVKLNSQRKTRKIPDFIKYADPNITSLRQLLSVCVKAAKAGGIKLQEIRRKYDVGLYSKTKDVEDVHPAISGKLHSYKAMYNILKKSFPELKIVSEHGYNKEFKSQDEELPDVLSTEFEETLEDVDVATKDILIWVDPLDGSKNYHDNHLEYVSTMVCVAVKGKPVIGVIHQPFENVTMWGWDGHYYSNATLRSISKSASVSSPNYITSALHADELKMNANIELGYDVNVVTASGAGYKILQLAVGNVDAYIHAAPIKKWDLCAGDAIIKALDGNMTGFNGKSVDYGNHSDVTLVGGVFGTISFHENYFDLTSAENSTSYSE